MNYQEYLLSPQWQAKREMALSLACWRCQVCNTENDLNVHHRTYDRLGHEYQADLVVLCRRCHGLFHEATKPVPPTEFDLKRRRRRAMEIAAGLDSDRENYGLSWILQHGQLSSEKWGQILELFSEALHGVSHD